MIKVKRRRIKVALLSCLSALTIALGGAVFGMHYGKTALAQPTADLSNPAKVVEIPELTLSDYDTRSDGKVFNGVALDKLYNALTGSSSTNATLTSVTSLVSGTVSYGASGYADGAKTISAYRSAQQLYTANGNKNIVVSFGGYKWTVTFLTKDLNGDPVATLWLADGQRVGNVDGAAYVRSRFGWNNESAPTNTSGGMNGAYPTNMYASSELRVKALNGGGDSGTYAYGSAGSTAYASSASATTSVPLSDRIQNDWAKFTLSNTTLAGSSKAGQSLTAFIDTPSEIAYQYYENFPYQYASQSGNPATYIITNDAIAHDITGSLTGTTGASTQGTGTGSNKWYTGGSGVNAFNGVTYSNKTGYDNWAYDYLWAPSLTETGYRYTSGGTTNADCCVGLWGTTYKTGSTWNLTDQTRFGGGATGAVAWNSSGNATTMNNGEFSWLRSGGTGTTWHSSYLSSSGASYGALTSRSLVVRPALHLNLKSAASAAALETADNVSQIEVSGTPQDIVYDSTRADLTITDMNPDWYDFDQYIDHSATVRMYKNTGDTTPFNTANPGTAVTAIKNAGRYEVTLTVKSSSPYKLSSSDGTTWTTGNTVKFVVTVKQKEVKYKWKNIGLNSTWETDFSDSIFNTHTNAPWVYLDYTLDSADNNKVGGANGTPSTTDNTVPYVILTYKDTLYGDADLTPDNNRTAKDSTGNYPFHAGNYTVSFEDKNKDTSNYKLVADSGETATKSYKINKMKLTDPADQNKTYDGSDLSFAVANYKSDHMDYGKWDGTTWTANDVPTDNTDTSNPISLTKDTSATLTFKGTDAGKYELYYRLKTYTKTDGTEVVRDYDWTTAAGQQYTKATYTIKPFTLEMDFTSSLSGGSFTAKANDTTNKVTVGFKSGKGPVTRTGASAADDVKYEVWFYYQSEGDTTAQVNPDTTNTNELLYKNLVNSSADHKTGKYVIVVKLKAKSDCAINANYTLDATQTATFTKEVEIKAGEASLDDIDLVYKDSTMGSSDAPKPLETGTNNLKYTWDSDNKKPVEFKPEFDFTNLPFMEMIGTPSYTNASNNAVTSLTGAGTYTVKILVGIKSADQASNKMPAQSDYDAITGKKFTYTRIDDTQGYLEFTYTIDKGDVNIDLTNLPLEYSSDGKTTWKTYDATNLPEYTGSKIYIRIKQPYPNGITATSVTIGESSTNIGTVAGNASFTVDTTNYNNITDKTFTWEIGPEIIDVDWGWMDYYDASGVYYQVRVLNYAKPEHAAAIEYEFFNTVSNTDLGLGAPAGIAEALTAGSLHNGLEILCTTASPTNPVPVWVRARIKTGVANYKLRDTSYNPSDASSVEFGTRFQLGDNKDMVKAELLATDLRYGGAKLPVSDILSLMILDGSGNPTMALPANQYTLKIYSGSDKINMSNNTLIGDLNDFDTSTAKAGSYVIEIELVKDASGETPYALSAKALVFEIGKKQITVPTLDASKGAITFNGQDISLQDYLLGFDSSLMSFDAGVSRRNAGTHSTVLSLLDKDNYEFVLPTAASAAKYALSDDAVSAIDTNIIDSGAAAEMKWTINKFVLGSADNDSIWNLNGKNGAAMNLPAWINEMITAGGLEVGYRYYPDATGAQLSEYQFKGGNTFYVDAVLSGSEAENFEFAKAGSGSTAANPVSTRIAYKVPQSGASAFFGNAMDFVKKNWLWFAIGAGIFLFLLLLIIILAATRRKRKEKAEERKLEKERKAEEKARKEEERRLKEEQREEEKRRRAQELEDAKAKAEAERELQKAKAEAELAKMKAEMSMGMGAGAMAMQAMPQAQQAMPMQQAMPQQPVSQPVAQQAPNADMIALITRLENELAEMRADRRAERQAQNYAMPMQMPMQMPMMQQPVYGPQQGGGSSDTSMMALMQAQLAQLQASHKAELAEMKADKSAAMRTEFEIMKMKLDGKNNGYDNYQPHAEQRRAPEPVNNVKGLEGNAETFGAVLASMVRNLASQQPAQEPKNELPQKTEESAPTTVNTPTVYPPDAVITTTTTVDTTKNTATQQPQRITRENDDKYFDIDGFYETFEEDK